MPMEEARRITAITPTRRGDRATIKVDGRAAVTLNLTTVDAMSLSVGDAVDEALLERLREAAAYDKAMRDAMNRINRRAMSTKRLDHKLAELGHGGNVRRRVLDRLTELGVLDDRALGEALIRETRRQRPAGPRLLKQKLIQRGIAVELAEELVRSGSDASEAAEQAADLARQRWRQLGRLEPTTRKRRVYGLLARRGFDSDAIDYAMRRLADEPNPSATR